MEKHLRELKGFSGSKIYLMEDEHGVFVRKIGNVDRNFERLSFLYDERFPVPRIISKRGDVLDMEYIHGIDMKTYLISERPHLDIAEFIINRLIDFREYETRNSLTDYLTVYEESIAWVDMHEEFPFTKAELIDRLPDQIYPSRAYHGDMTLENILYTEDRGFVFIDPVTVVYDSWVFDIPKLRQDLECRWFIRHDPTVNIHIKLADIQDRLRQRFGGSIFDDHLLILMLLRVYVHTTPGSFEHNFILKEINRLWK